MTVRIEHGDCLAVIPALVAEGVTVDSIVTDPPYHLTATLARFGKININDDTATSRRLRKKADGAARLAHGFMNQQWDGGDIAFRPETWATIATVLRPGGFLLAFGGPRTYHRLTCAIEDAGLVIQDCCLWLYGTGFPKRRDAFKPAYEPIVLAYKPGGSRTMQIDECRVGTGIDKGVWPVTDRAKTMDILGKYKGHSSTNVSLGRWPANLCHDGSEEVLALFPQTGISSGGRIGNAGGGTVQNIPTGHFTKGDPGYGDSGSAARFFWSPKASKKERQGSRHPTVKPLALTEWLVRLVTPPGGTVLDPFAGTGVCGQAAMQSGRNAILIEREAKYVLDTHYRLAAEGSFERRMIELIRASQRLGRSIERWL